MKCKMFVKSNNLEFTRFIAAILVILSHSFPIEYGNNKREPLMVLSKGFISFGGAAVCIFFLCGGWLCIKSIQKVRWEKAIINRIKRLIPELFLIIGLSVILGSFLTVLPPIEYWGNMETWKYFLNCLLIPIHELPGVFINAKYNSTVNGSLWTLPLEFLMFLITLFAYQFGLMKKKYLNGIIFFVACIYFTCFLWKYELFVIIRPCVFWVLGIFVYIYKDTINWNRQWALMMGILGIGLIIIGIGILGIIIMIYSFIFFWFYEVQISQKYAFVGKYTYSIYLCAFPIQQFVAMVNGYDESWMKNFVVSSIFAVIIGIINYEICGMNKAVNNRNEKNN